ncbi:hypothetical protein [Methanobrevibacter sp.]|uniref:hypothetical protein n=1 Tax=Methanobrevibacter sp. TaxID=66852 RepID=UPI00389098B4
MHSRGDWYFGNGFKYFTINGNGHTIDCNNKFNAFDVDLKENWNSITIKNVRFINGDNKDGKGGAVTVINGDIVEFINCTFENNKAKNGGAISINNDGELRIINCTFINNIADDKGGAIYKDEGKMHISFFRELPIYVINSNFVTNQAQEGGAIYLKCDFEILDAF